MKAYTNVKPKFANEFLDLIGKDSNIKAALWEHGKKPPLNFLLAMNFDKRIEFDLPEGMPPYNRNEADHPDMYAPLASNIRRIMTCLKTDGRHPRWKKENIFIQMLEGCNPKEADILVFAKDKALHELYPWLTIELVKEVFPDYVHEVSTWGEPDTK